MTKNNEVTNDFINDCENQVKNLFSERKNEVLVLYSYGYHFPLSILLEDGVYLINMNGYSQTTSQHKGHLARSLRFANFKDLELNHDKSNIVLMTTNQLKRVLDFGFKNYSEIVEDKI